MKTSKNYRLKELVRISAGHPFRGKIIETLHSDIKVVQLKNVDVFQGIDWNGCISSELTGKKAPNFLQAGDVLYSSRGAYNAYYVDQGIGQIDAVASPHFFIIRSDKTLLLPDFLTLVFNDSMTKRYIEKHAVGSFTKSLSKQALADMPISIPSVSRQQKLIDLANTIHQQRQALEGLIDNDAKLLSGLLSQSVTILE